MTVQLQQATEGRRAAQHRLTLLLGRRTTELTTSTDLRQTGPQLARIGAKLLRSLPAEDSSALVGSPTLAATARSQTAGYQLQTQQLGIQYQQTLANTHKFASPRTYYEQTGLPRSRAIISQSQRLFRAGEISCRRPWLSTLPPTRKQA